MRAIRVSIEGLILVSLLTGAFFFALLLLFKGIVFLLLIAVMSVIMDRVYLKRKGRLDAGRSGDHNAEGKTCHRS
jgi:hypothetical protein